MTAAANSSVFLGTRKEGANIKDMMPATTTFPINKALSYYACCKCTTKPAGTTKPADYYVLTGENLKSPTRIIPLCDVCYQQQYHSRRRSNRT